MATILSLAGFLALQAFLVKLAMGKGGEKARDTAETDREKDARWLADYRDGR